MYKFNYVGVLKDRLQELPERKTRKYITYTEAYRAVIQLAKKHYGSSNRERISIDTIDIEE